MLSRVSNFFRRVRKPKGIDVPTGGAAAELARVFKRASLDEVFDLMGQAAKESAPYAEQFKQVAPWLIRSFGNSELPNELLQEKQESRIAFAKAAEAKKDKAGTARADIDFDNLGRDTSIQLIRPVGLSFEQLRRIGKTDPINVSIDRTQINLVLRYLRPSNQEWKPGFKVKYADDQKTVTDNDADRFTFAKKFLLNCGAEFDPRRRRALRRDNLNAFARKHLEDSLIGDAAPIELIPTRSGRTHGFKAVDMANVYLTDPFKGMDDNSGWNFDQARERKIHIPNPNEIFAVLSKNGIPLAPYSHQELLYPIRNPTSDERQLGYGQPELETILRIITGFLNALELNIRGITHNSIPTGILNMFGDFDKKDVQDLKNWWRSQVQGMVNRFGLPLLISKDRESGAQYVQTSTPPNEVMYSRWITLLVAISCAVKGVDPSQINFDSYRTSTGNLSGSDSAEQISAARDGGLYPLVQWLFESLNEILQTIDPELEVYPTGLEPDQAASKADEVNMLTWNEYRQRRGEPALDDEELGNAPLNPTLMQFYQSRIQAKEQAKMQAQNPQQAPGQPGQDPGQPPTADQRPPGFEEGAQIQDHQNNEYDAQPDQAQPDPSQQPRMAKAAMLDLETWYDE